MNLVLSPSQILIVGLIATILASLLGWIIQAVIPWFVAKVWKKPITIPLGRVIKTLLVTVFALALAWWWYPVSLPAFPILVGTLPEKANMLINWLPVLCAALTPYLGSAIALYNLILGYVTDPDRRAKVIKILMDWLFPDLPRISPGQ